MHSNICEKEVSCLHYDPHCMRRLGSGNVIWATRAANCNNIVFLVAGISVWQRPLCWVISRSPRRPVVICGLRSSSLTHCRTDSAFVGNVSGHRFNRWYRGRLGIKQGRVGEWSAYVCVCLSCWTWAQTGGGGNPQLPKISYTLRRQSVLELSLVPPLCFGLPIGTFLIVSVYSPLQEIK